MSKLIILCGISGAGKSSFAHKEWLKDPLNTVLVSRDNIRYMYGYTEETISEYYTRNDFSKLEKQVTEYETILIKQGLSLNKTVIVDATHLNQKYIDRFKFFNVDTELVMFSIDLNEAIKRDSLRNRKVGEEVIKRQYSQFINFKPTEMKWSKETLQQDKRLPNCIVFDIDGTLAHMKDRSPYDWSKVKEDTVDEAVANLYKIHSSLNNDFLEIPRLVICTGRDGICSEDTKKWLYNNQLIDFDLFYIRKQGDQRPDWQVKREMWEDISKYYNILYLVDDRNQVVDYARSLGLKVFQVAEGNF